MLTYVDVCCITNAVGNAARELPFNDGLTCEVVSQAAAEAKAAAEAQANAEAEAKAVGDRAIAEKAAADTAAGTHFTCFTSTKVQLLTLTVSCPAFSADKAELAGLYSLYQYTGTNTDT